MLLSLSLSLSLDDAVAISDQVCVSANRVVAFCCYGECRSGRYNHILRGATRLARWAESERPGSGSSWRDRFDGTSL